MLFSKILFYYASIYLLNMIVYSNNWSPFENLDHSVQISLSFVDSIQRKNYKISKNGSMNKKKWRSAYNLYSFIHSFLTFCEWYHVTFRKMKRESLTLRKKILSCLFLILIFTKTKTILMLFVTQKRVLCWRKI